MGGRFNPFQSKQQEVLRPHAVADECQARKLLAKCQKKRPCVWAEVSGLDDPTARETLASLDGAASVVLFLNRAAPALPEPLPPAIDELITRLWKNFNKLYLVHLGDGSPRTEEAEDGG